MRVGLVVRVPRIAFAEKTFSAGISHRVTVRDLYSHPVTVRVPRIAFAEVSFPTGI